MTLDQQAPTSAVVDRTEEDLTHVPLIVKLPGQTPAMSVDSDFRTCRLSQIIARGLSGGDAAQVLAAAPTPASVGSGVPAVSSR